MQPYLSTGVGADPGASGGRGFYSLGAGTYYVEIGGVDTSVIVSPHFRWTASLAATITIESSNLAEKEAPLVSSNASAWLQENPTTSGITVAGAGNSITNLTITAGGTNAGGVRPDIGNMSASRLRAKIVVTVAGDLQTSVMGKP